MVFIAAALLAGCNGDPTPSTAVAQLMPKPKPKVAPVPVKRGPSREEMTAGMVEAVSLAKSNVAVGLKFQMTERPVLGEPLEVVVAVLPESEADSATLQVAGSDGLQLRAGTALREIPTIEAGQVYKESIKVTPTAEGVQLLTLTVALKNDETSESRAFSVPLIVAPAAASAGTARH